MTSSTLKASIRLAAAIAIGTGALAGCSSDNNGNLTASTVAVVSGNTQTGTVGLGLAAPFVVKVTDKDGNPVQGVTVTFTATSGASLMSSTAVTNAQGLATDSLTVLGSVVGSGTVTASVAGVSTPATFNFTANAGGASNVVVVSGNTQTGTVGLGLTTPFVVKVTDQAGNPVQGAIVTFAASNGASLITPTATTNAQGQATDSLTILGNTAGNGTVTASVAGVTTPATFTFTANAGAAASVVVVSGNNQSATAGSALASPMVVVVKDAFGNPVTNATVVWTTTAGSLAGQATTVTDNSGNSQAALQLPAVPGAVTVTATLQGTNISATFTETAM